MRSTTYAARHRNTDIPSILAPSPHTLFNTRGQIYAANAMSIVWVTRTRLPARLSAVTTNLHYFSRRRECCM